MVVLSELWKHRRLVLLLGKGSGHRAGKEVTKLCPAKIFIYGFY